MEAVEPLIRREFDLERSKQTVYEPVRDERKAVEQSEVIERLDVNQGKLNMGLSAYVTYGDDAYPAALVYNGLLGGYPHSKLFIQCAGEGKFGLLCFFPF